MRTAYQWLGVSEQASDAEIKQAYLAQIRLYPPEHHPERFQMIRAAFEKIETERKRAEYALFDVAEVNLCQLLGDHMPKVELKRPSAKRILDLLQSSLES